MTYKFKNDRDRADIIDRLEKIGFKKVGGVYYKNSDLVGIRIVIGQFLATIQVI